jgi:peroxiredoxin
VLLTLTGTAAVLSAGALQASESSEALDLLSATAAHYQALQGYEFSGRIEGAAPSGRVRMEGAVTIAASSGDLVASAGPLTMIPEMHYTHGWTARTEDGTGFTGQFAGPHIFGNYAAVATGVLSARSLRSEALAVDGASVDCRVIEVNYGDSPVGRAHGGLVRYWIDPARHIVLRQEFTESDSSLGGDVGWTLTFSSVSLNKPAPEWLVATVTSRVQLAEDWVDREAPDFTLPQVDGPPVTLSELRGRVVLLAFWATWCGPCKEEMPNLEALSAEYGEKGLTVLGVTGDPPELVREWLREKQRTLSTVADSEGMVSESYQVDGLPTTAVIAPDGKVVRYLVGLQPPSVLRAAVDQALGRRLSSSP